MRNGLRCVVCKNKSQMMMTFFIGEIESEGKARTRERAGVYCNREICMCVCVVKRFSLGFRLNSESTEVNFIAAQFQAFVFPPATTPDMRAPVAPNFLFLLSCCHHLFQCVRVHVYVCPCHHKSHSPLTCRLSRRN